MLFVTKNPNLNIYWVVGDGGRWWLGYLVGWTGVSDFLYYESKFK